MKFSSILYRCLCFGLPSPLDKPTWIKPDHKVKLINNYNKDLKENGIYKIVKAHGNNCFSLKNKREIIYVSAECCELAEK